MANSNQIDKTSYYQLPCGRFLEDFIYNERLNFNFGSALKYKWRAGKKDGESMEKDLAKAEHYIRAEAEMYWRLNGVTNEETLKMAAAVNRDVVDRLLERAEKWDGKLR